MRNRIHGALILARYSTDNQNPDTIEVQVERCTKYCHEYNLPILGVYADYAVSGMKDTRPQQSRMMEDLKNGVGDTIVIYDQSRMFRDLVYWFNFREQIAAMGVDIRSATQSIIGGDLKDPTNFMLEASMATFNQMHVLISRQKTVEKLNYLARHLQHTGGIPALGFRVETVLAPDGETVISRHLVIDEKEAAIVRRIFEEYDSGKSYREILEGLNRDGLRTKRGSPFGTNSLHDLLCNEKYIGTLVYNAHAKGKSPHGQERKDVIRQEDAFPAIVPKDMFFRVKAKMLENKRAQAGRPASVRVYPLKGKVFCGSCGCSMCVRRSKTIYYYACSDSRRTRICRNPQIRVDWLEDKVTTYVRSLLCDPGLKDTALNAIRAESNKITSSAISRLTALQEDGYKIKTQMSRLVDAIADGVATDAIRAKLAALETRQQETERQIQALQNAVEVSTIPPDALSRIFDTIQSSPDPSAILELVTRVEVYPEHIIVYTLYDPTDPTTKSKSFRFPADSPVLTIPGIPGGSPKKRSPSGGLFF